MPKIKLRDWQFNLMRDALLEKAMREENEAFRMACEFLEEEHEYSKDEAENVMVTAMNKAGEKIRACVAKKNLLISENEEENDEDPGSERKREERQKNIDALLKEKKVYEDFLSDLIARRAMVRDINTIIQVLEKKATSKDIIKYYDDDALYASMHY